MMEETFPDVVPDFSTPALREWQELTEHVLRGIAHSLNNRASAISAVLELSSDPDDDLKATTSILASELDRIRDLVTTVRVIGTPLPRTDALSAADAAREAQLVLSFHAAQRNRSVAFDAAGAPPIRVPRWMFVRALIALGASVSRDSVASALTVTVTEDGDWLVARAERKQVRVREGEHVRSAGAEPSPYTAEIAVAMGGEPFSDGRTVGFRVPTLAALRRREGR